MTNPACARQIDLPAPKSATAANIRLIRITARFNQVALRPGRQERPAKQHRPYQEHGHRRALPGSTHSAFSHQSEGETRVPPTATAAVARNHHSANVKSLQKEMLMIPAATTLVKMFNHFSSATGRLDAQWDFQTTGPNQ